MKKIVKLLSAAFAVAACALVATSCEGGENNENPSDNTDPQEDLSALYLVRESTRITYHTYDGEDQPSPVIERVYTYDGRKVTAIDVYLDGQLNNSSTTTYDGLTATFFVEGEVFATREYLDDSYLRIKREVDSYGNVHEYEYDGKKRISYKSIDDGTVTYQEDYEYDGLEATWVESVYDSSVSSITSGSKTFLDNTYLRTSYELLVRADANSGQVDYKMETYNTYDGKKLIKNEVWYDDGNCRAISNKAEYVWEGNVQKGTAYVYVVNPDVPSIHGLTYSTTEIEREYLF